MSTQTVIDDPNRSNQAQKTAVEWDEGPLLLLGGPGSGKTFILTSRIVRLVDESRRQNFRILCLTSNNAAANAIRNRVMEHSPDQAQRVFIGTYHTFCAEVLRQHGTHLGFRPNFQIYSQDADLLAIFADAIADAIKEAKSTFPKVSFSDKRFLPVIRRLKSQFVLPEHSAKRFKDPDFGKLISVLYSAYEAELSRQNALDFDSLVLKTYQLFQKFPVFAEHYRIVYPYLCIDNFQDSSYARYQMIQAMIGKHYHNIFIVANTDQVIFQSNPSRHSLVETFLEQYSPTVIELSVNYRCPPQIIELANNLIQAPPRKFPKTSTFISGKMLNKEEDNVRLLGPFEDFDEEANEIAHDIQQRHVNHSGTMAVLGRTRKILRSISVILDDAGISAAIAQRKDTFESTPFMWLMSMLRLANERQSQRHLEMVCGTFEQLTQKEVDPEEVMTLAAASNNDYLQHWIKILLQEPLEKFVAEIVTQAAMNLGEGRNFYAFSKYARMWFQKLIQDREADHSQETFALYEEEEEIWQELTKNIKPERTLEAFLQELQMRSKEAVLTPDTVQLMTISGARGKEFDHVYLVGMVEDEFPFYQSIRQGDNSLAMQRERRDCFVAVTRARETLTISYAKRYKRWKKKPSRFLYEMELLNEG